MSADELVVRLQATLDEKERLAQAAVDREAFWALASEWPGKPVADHVLANTPKDVLRLVQAHRDILDKLARTKRLLDEANERVLQQVMDGTVSTRQEQRDFDSLHVEEAVLAEVVEDLARGYGLEDDHE